MGNSKRTKIQSISESVVLEVVNEDENNSSDVDGINVLAKVRGKAFFPDAISENNTYYSEQFWRDVLADAEVKRRLDDRIIYGTIGHSIDDLGDDEIREGNVSHIVTKMWIDDETKIGYAEFLVLNTKVGKTLNTILRAKSKLRVSTKGTGELSPDSKLGYNIPSNFVFDRIDFVLRPGFKDALPSVVESKQDNLDGKDSNGQPSSDFNQHKQEESEMPETTNKDEAIKDANVDKAITVLESQVKRYQEDNNSLTTDLSKANDELGKYRALGTPEEIQTALNTSSDTIDELTSKLADADIKTDTAVKEAGELEQYRALGTPEEIKQVINKADELDKQVSEARKIAEAARLSAKYRTSTKIVEALLDSNEPEAVDKLLGEVVKEDEDETNGINTNPEAPQLTPASAADATDTTDANKVNESRRRPNNFIGKQNIQESVNANSLAGNLLCRINRF